MTHRLPLALLAAAVFTLTAAHAQSDDDDDDQEFDFFAYFTRARSNLKFGFRETEGAKVKFGNLGSIPAAALDDFLLATPTRTYANGAISYDTTRSEEVDVAGNQTSTPGGRYQVLTNYIDANGVPYIDASGKQILFVKGDYVSFTTGFTRNYAINDPSQVANGNIVLTQYSAISEGAGYSGKRNISGGVQLEVERLFTNPAKRFRFSLVGGISLNGINSKRSGTVTSDLHVLTDAYALMNGASLPTTATYPYSTPDFVAATFLDTAGNSVSGQMEQTVPVSSSPTRTEADIPGGVDVTGVWEIKGSYLVLRVGPQLSGSLTPNLSFNASAGFAAAYVGTNYTATESAILTDPTLLTNDTISTGAITSETSKLLPGYYANIDASWAVNERSGFFAGLSYESFGQYDQTLEGRTASIDLGGNTSVSGGLNIKF